MENFYNNNKNKYRSYLSMDIPEHILKNPKFKTLNLDTCLNIMIPGIPMAEPRPRFVNGTVVSLGAIEMTNYFKPFYKSDKLLNNMIITSPYVVDMKFFMPMTQKDLKEISKDKKLMKLYQNEELLHIDTKDTDNMLKIYGDMLFRKDFRITIEDGHNPAFINPIKLYSEYPRTEIKIYFNETLKYLSFYKKKVERSAKYFEMLLCEKHMKMNKRTERMQLNHLKKVIHERLDNHRSEDKQLAILKSVYTVFEEYPAELLKDIARLGKDNGKYNKYDAEAKLLLLICDGKYNNISNRIMENVKKSKVEESKPLMGNDFKNFESMLCDYGGD